MGYQVVTKKIKINCPDIVASRNGKEQERSG